MQTLRQALMSFFGRQWEMRRSAVSVVQGELYMCTYLLMSYDSTEGRRDRLLITGLKETE